MWTGLLTLSAVVLTAGCFAGASSTSPHVRYKQQQIASLSRSVVRMGFGVRLYVHQFTCCVKFYLWHIARSVRVKVGGDWYGHLEKHTDAILLRG